MARRKPRNVTPLPARDGLGPSRVRLPGEAPVTAWDFIHRVISEQRYRHPTDGEQALIERFAAGEVVLRDGTPLSPSSPVEPGTDVFFYRRPAPETPVPFAIDVIHEDDDLLVVNKPPFLSTMPRGAHITETVTVRLRRATGNEELTPAHRLDRLTAGVLLLTKRREVRGLYQEMFAQRGVSKLYEAIAPEVGVAAPTSWEHHLEKTPGDIAARLVEGAEPNAATIVHEVRPLGDRAWGAGLARYLLEPITGRTHQLRVQMHAAGCPIVNDDVYPVIRDFGTDDYTKPMLLASVAVEFKDPRTGKTRFFSAPGYSGLPA